MGPAPRSDEPVGWGASARARTRAPAIRIEAATVSDAAFVKRDLTVMSPCGRIGKPLVSAPLIRQSLRIVAWIDVLEAGDVVRLKQVEVLRSLMHQCRVAGMSQARFVAGLVSCNLSAIGVQVDVKAGTLETPVEVAVPGHRAIEECQLGSPAGLQIGVPLTAVV